MKEREKWVVKEEPYDEHANERTKARPSGSHLCGRLLSSHQTHQVRLVRIVLRVKGCLPVHFMGENKRDLLNSAFVAGCTSVQNGWMCTLLSWKRGSLLPLNVRRSILGERAARQQERYAQNKQNRRIFQWNLHTPFSVCTARLEKQSAPRRF